MNAASRKRTFNVVGATATAPTAEPVTPPEAEKPATTAKSATARRRQPKPASAPEPAATTRTAYTWRRTADQVMTMDELMIKLKRELRRPKLDSAEVLSALVEMAADSPPVFGALVSRLQ